MGIGLEPGDVTTRGALVARYKGSDRNGIVTTKVGKVFVYSDHTVKKSNGYEYDGWEDASGQVFYYSGEGQTGDQVMRAGNRALAESENRGLEIHLFETLAPKNLVAKNSSTSESSWLIPRRPTLSSEALTKTATSATCLCSVFSGCRDKLPYQTS